MAVAFLFLLILRLNSGKVFAAVTINNIVPENVTSTDTEIIINASVSASNSQQYLQVAITKEGNSNYFGLTQNNNGAWNNYRTASNGNGINGLFNFLPENNVWSGQIKAKIDATSTNFKGNGNYVLKLYKYVSSLGSSVDSNAVPFVVSLSDYSLIKPVSETPTPTISARIIDWGLDTSSLQVGKVFGVNINLSGFDSNSSYYLKTRGGTGSQLSALVTKNNSNFYSDNAGWVNFPQAQVDVNGHWEGKIYSKVNNDFAGQYLIILRLKRTDSDVIYDSPSKNFNFIIGEPNVTITPTAKPSIATSKIPSVLGVQSTKNTISTESNYVIDLTTHSEATPGSSLLPSSLSNATSILVAEEKAHKKDTLEIIIALICLLGIIGLVKIKLIR